MKAVAKELREADKKHWTQARLATVFGVDQRTVSYWFVKDSRTNTKVGNTSNATPDARVKVSPVEKPTIAKRVKAGESQSQVAADYGVSQRRKRRPLGRSMGSIVLG